MGDHVILHEDEDFVREQFRIFKIPLVNWTEGLATPYGLLRPMLGKSYPVIPKEEQKLIENDSNWVGVPSNDLRYGKTWYYPKTTLRKDHIKSLIYMYLMPWHHKKY